MHDTPNPLGEPEPIEAKPSNAFLNSIAGVGIIVWGVILFAAGVVPGRTQGVSQSRKLKWQQRQCEVDQAVAAQQSVDDNKSQSGAHQPPSSAN